MPDAINKLGFGSAGLTSIRSLSAVMRLLDAAFDNGITHFDTAPLYGQGYAEDIIGTFIKAKRNKLTLTTKFGLGHSGPLKIPASLALPLNYYRKKLKGNPGSSPVTGETEEKIELIPYRRITSTEIQTALVSSLKKLRTDHIDYYFIHEGLPSFLDQDALQFLLEQKKKGVINFLGVAAGSHNLLSLKGQDISDWSILQYEAGQNNSLLKDIFPEKQHFLHSCLKGLQSSALPGVPPNQQGGYRLASCAHNYTCDKLLFATRRINVLQDNLQSFKQYIRKN